MRRFSRVLLVVPVLLAGCFKNPGAPESDVGNHPAPEVELQENRLVIINDPAVLASRVSWTSTPLFVEAKEFPGHELVAGKVLRTDLTLVGDVSPPDVDGNIVQANDIAIYGNRALVAFNFAGEIFAGAVQVIDFSRADQPRVIAEVQYRNADVTAVAFHGDYVYVGLGSNDPALLSGAMMEEFYLRGARLERTGRWVDLPSSVVTDLGAFSTHMIATVGAAGGGVALIERNNGKDLVVDAFNPEDDLRGFDVISGTSVVAVCGTTPRMGTLGMPQMSGSMASIDGFMNPDAKGTVEYYDELCWLGSGDGGFQVRNATGDLVARLENREFSELRPDQMIANAVSVMGNRAYVAAGALGVQVVDVTSIRLDKEEKVLRPMGELTFPEGVSSNMVKVKGPIMVVAAGAGGVKLVHMRTVRDGD